MENPIKMDDLGVSLFLETPTWKLQKNMDETSKRRTEKFGSRNDWKKTKIEKNRCIYPHTPCTKPLRIHQNIPSMVQSPASLQKLPLHCFTQRVQKNPTSFTKFKFYLL